MVSISPRWVSEKLCAEADWMRAYGEINDFEEQLAEAGGKLFDEAVQMIKTYPEVAQYGA